MIAALKQLDAEIAEALGEIGRAMNGLTIPELIRLQIMIELEVEGRRRRALASDPELDAELAKIMRVVR